MRVLLNISDCYQLYETVDIMAGECDNPYLAIRLSTGQEIIVENVFDPLTCLKTLMAHGYVDLSLKRSYFMQAPPQYCEQPTTEEYGTEREIEYEELEK